MVMSVKTSHIIKLEPFPVSEFWKSRNEQNNFNQRHDVELIKEEQRRVVESEIRKQVQPCTFLRTQYLVWAEFHLRCSAFRWMKR